MNTDSRQRIISRRVLTPKGDDEGGGGGSRRRRGHAEGLPRAGVLARLGRRPTPPARRRVDVKLPESLTTYRIMAVAAIARRASAAATREVRVNKPVTLKPTFPRFLAVGDTALFGAVVTSQLADGGTAIVTMRSLDPPCSSSTGDASRRCRSPPADRSKCASRPRAKAIGRARVQMTVKLGDETDAFEDAIPVEVLASPETVAAYGEAARRADAQSRR